MVIPPISVYQDIGIYRYIGIPTNLITDYHNVPYGTSVNNVACELLYTIE